MSDKTEMYKEALLGKTIPILTLDNKWHKLFTQTGASEIIITLENELNDLLKRQGKLNTDSRSYRLLKTKLMKEVVETMEAADSKDAKALKRMDELKASIEECNAKIDEYQDELLELPKLIDDKNKELMVETMKVCREKMQENAVEIANINQWIREIKGQVKANVIKRQEKEIWNQQLYKYMHETFGAEVIEMFDITENMGLAKHYEEDTSDTKE